MSDRTTRWYLRLLTVQIWLQTAALIFGALALLCLVGFVLILVFG